MIIEPHSTERDLWLDWCRAFAIVAVVLVHSVEQLISIEDVWHPSTPALSQIGLLLVFTIGRLGVPVFLFLTGYLIPGRYEIRSAADYWFFIRRKWLPLFVCAELWAVITGIILVVALPGYNVRVFLDLMLFSTKATLSHWWYLPVILGLYLFLPFLSFVSGRIGSRAILFLLGVSFFAHVIRPLSRLVSFDWGALDLSFVGDCFMTFILWGYVVFLYRERLLSTFRSHFARLLVVFLLGLNLAVCIYSQMIEQRFIWHSWPPLITAGLLTPIGILLFREIRFCVVERVSVCAFGIYLIHNLILKGVQARAMNIHDEILRVGLTGVVTVILSLVIVMAVCRCWSWAGYILFLIRPRKGIVR